MYIIRESSLEDTEVLDKLLTLLIRDEKKYDSNINEEFVVENFYENIINKDCNIIYVAEEDNKIVGYLYGYIKENDVTLENTAVLDALYVIDEYRNKGVATSLVNGFKSWSRENNARYIEVQVLNKNIDAFNLYKMLGFNELKSILVNDLD